MNNSSHKLYNTWKKMRDRCNNKNSQNYQYYGGKGVKVCKAWDNFETFLKDVGERPSPQHTLDRINSNGNYSKGNCRWATKEEQSRNRSRVLIFNGETVPQISRRFGVDRSYFLKMLKLGKTVDEILQNRTELIARPIQLAA